MRSRTWLAAVACSFFLSALVVCAPFHEASDQVDGGSPSDAVAPGSDSADGVDTGTCEGEPSSYATLDGGASTAVCDGTSVKVLTSAIHCGRCGHRCSLGTCDKGYCVAQVVLYDPATRPRVVGSDERRVYYGEGNGGSSVYAYDPDGGQDGGVHVGNTGRLSAVVSDGTSAYGRHADAIFRLGGAPGASDVQIVMPSASASQDVPTLALAGDLLFFTVTTGLHFVPTAANSSEQPGVKGRGGDVVATSSDVYWMNESWRDGDGGTSLERRRVADGVDSPPLAVVAGAATGLAINRTHAYFLHFVGSVADGETQVEQLFRVALDGSSTPELLNEATTGSTTKGYRLPLVLGKNHVFWYRRTSTPPGYVIMKRAKCGGAAVPITEPLSGDSLGFFDSLEQADALGLANVGGVLYYAANDTLFALSE